MASAPAQEEINITHLPWEIVDHITSFLPVGKRMQIIRKYRAMYPTPGNALAFIEDIESWTVDTILAHIAEVTRWPLKNSRFPRNETRNGKIINKRQVKNAIKRAVLVHPDPLPLVLQSLYNARPKFVRVDTLPGQDRGFTVMYVPPITHKMPELMYGCETGGRLVGAHLSYWKWEKFYNLDPEGPTGRDKIGRMINCLIESWVNGHVSHQWNTALAQEDSGFGWGRGWEEDATEEEQMSLLQALQVNTRQFFPIEKDANYACKTMLLLALEDTRPIVWGSSDFYIRDVCV